MSEQIGLYPGQLRAIRARGRELLLAAEPQSGASHLLRRMALLRAVGQDGSAVVIASPDDRSLRESHMEGEESIWRMLDRLPAGVMRWTPGRVARFKNGSTIHLTTWEAAGKRAPDLLLIDDADELGRPAFERLRERALGGPSPDADRTRLAIVSRRAGEGWVRDHWRSLNGAGGMAEMRAEEIPARLRRLVASIALKSFGDWISGVMPDFPWYPHTELMVETIQRVVTGEILRLLIQAPPRHFKSLIVSRLLPAYFLSVRPDEWAAVVAATEPLAKIMSSDAREFYRGGGGVFRDDSQDKSLWRTPRGGGMWARGVGGWVLGVGYNLGVIDDPFAKWEEAMKASVQEAVETYFWKTFYSRREITGTRPAAIIVMHQRLAEGDLAGRLMRREAEGQHPTEEFHLLDLPAIKRQRREPIPAAIAIIPDKRQDGEPLCPQLQGQDLEGLLRLEAVDKILFAAQHQQEPFPEKGGGLFERWWWRYACDPSIIASLAAESAQLTALITALTAAGLLPEMIQEARAWDIAASLEGMGDASASTRGGITALQQVIFTDAFEKSVDAPYVEDLIIETAQRDGPGVKVILPEEPAAAGKILIAGLKRRLEGLGFHVETVSTTGSKYVRAMPHAGAAKFSEDGRPGRCLILPGAWNDLFTTRHHRFDGVTKPLDLVDATSYLFAALDAATFLRRGGIR